MYIVYVIHDDRINVVALNDITITFYVCIRRYLSLFTRCICGMFLLVQTHMHCALCITACLAFRALYLIFTLSSLQKCV